MTKGSANTPMSAGVLPQLEAVELTPLQRQRAKRTLQRAERLVDLLFASAARLKRLTSGPRRTLRRYRW